MWAWCPRHGNFYLKKLKSPLIFRLIMPDMTDMITGRTKNSNKGDKIPEMPAKIPNWNEKPVYMVSKYSRDEQV